MYIRHLLLMQAILALESHQLIKTPQTSYILESDPRYAAVCHLLAICEMVEKTQTALLYNKSSTEDTELDGSKHKVLYKRSHEENSTDLENYVNIPAERCDTCRMSLKKFYPL